MPRRDSGEQAPHAIKSPRASRARTMDAKSLLEVIRFQVNFLAQLSTRKALLLCCRLTIHGTTHHSPLPTPFNNTSTPARDDGIACRVPSTVTMATSHRLLLHGPHRVYTSARQTVSYGAQHRRGAEVSSRGVPYRFLESSHLHVLFGTGIRHIRRNDRSLRTDAAPVYSSSRAAAVLRPMIARPRSARSIQGHLLPQSGAAVQPPVAQQRRPRPRLAH